HRGSKFARKRQSSIMQLFLERARRQPPRRGRAQYGAGAAASGACSPPVRPPKPPAGCTPPFSLDLSDSNPCSLVNGEFEMLLQLQRASYQMPLQRHDCRAACVSVFENHPSILPPEILSHPPCSDLNLRLRHLTGLFQKPVTRKKVLAVVRNIGCAAAAEFLFSTPKVPYLTGPPRVD